MQRGLVRVGKFAAVWLLALAGLMGIAVGQQAAGPEPPGSLRVGILAGPPPYYQFSAVTGEPVGFALDLWTAVAQRAGLAYGYEYFDDAEALAKAARDGSVDIVPLLAIDEKSAALFDFTRVVHKSPVLIFTRKADDRIARVNDLKGHRVSVIKGHSGQKLMREFRGELSIPYDTIYEALDTLLSQTSDALIYEKDVLLQQARRRGVESLLKGVGEPLQKIELAIAVRKGQPQLVAKLNRAAKHYLNSDAIYEAREPWGGNPAPLIDTRTVIRALGALLAATIAGLGLWHYVSVIRLNGALSQSIERRKQVEERFRDLAEFASDWFFEQDKDLRFTFVSPRFEVITGIPTEGIDSHTRLDQQPAGLTPQDTENWSDHVALLKSHKDWQDFTYTLTTADGSKRTIMTSGKAIFDKDGRFQGYRGVGRDITRRIELEQSLQQAQKMELVGQLTGGIAHDFNNLLAVMVGNLEMLKRHLKDDSRTKPFLDTASDAVEVGSQLTQRLLAFSRRQALHPQSIDLNALVGGTMSLVRSSLGSNIAVNLQFDVSSPFIFADKSQLQNALLNLAINARDAMPDGGTLSIRTCESELDAAFVAKHPEASAGRYVILEVVDTGTGIAEDDIAKVVEPFFTTKDIGKGSGLGLSMVYGFARQSGGFLLIDSTVGEGSTFRIYLPWAELDAELETDAKSGPAASTINGSMNADGKTVLVVEDNDAVRQIAVIRLEQLGYEVIEAADATDALDKLKSNSSIDVLLTDVVMPGGMSGIDLAGEVSRTRPEIKVLFSTGYAKQAEGLGESGELHKLGPLLRKPYKQDELAHKLHELLAPPDNR